MAIKDNDRILLCKTVGRAWEVISNPRKDGFMTAMSGILYNYANDYAEYKNCGVRYRMIRRDQLSEYRLPETSVGMSDSELL